MEIFEFIGSKQCSLKGQPPPMNPSPSSHSYPHSAILVSSVPRLLLLFFDSAVLFHRKKIESTRVCHAHVLSLN